MQHLNLRTRQYVKVKTVEKATAWLVVAILVEERGNEVFALSEPRILRIIPKVNTLALTGKSSSSRNILALPAVQTILGQEPIKSPYFSSPLHLNTNSTIVWFSAQPPTSSF